MNSSDRCSVLRWIAVGIITASSVSDSDDRSFAPGSGDILTLFHSSSLERLLVGSHFPVSAELSGFKSEFCQGHLRTVTELFLSHSCVALAVCSGSLSYYKMTLWPSLRSWALWIRISPILCFAVGMLLGRRWAAPGFLLVWCLELRPFCL